MSELWQSAPIGEESPDPWLAFAADRNWLSSVHGRAGNLSGSIIAQSAGPGATTRFTGGPQEIALIVAVFGLVISFGLASMAGGLWQIIYGKPNRKVMVVMFLVAGILVAIGWAIKHMS